MNTVQLQIFREQYFREFHDPALHHETTNGCVDIHVARVFISSRSEKVPNENECLF